MDVFRRLQASRWLRNSCLKLLLFLFKNYLLLIIRFPASHSTQHILIKKKKNTFIRVRLKDDYMFSKVRNLSMEKEEKKNIPALESTGSIIMIEEY